MVEQHQNCRSRNASRWSAFKKKKTKKITLYADLLPLFIGTSKKMNGSYMTDKTHMITHVFVLSF